MTVTVTFFTNQKINKNGSLTGPPGGFDLRAAGVLGADGLPAVNPDTGNPYHQWEVDATLPQAQEDDPANSCLTTLLASWDGGTTYSAWGSPQDWHGGIGPKGNDTQPSFSGALPVSAQGVFARLLKATFDVQSSPGGLTVTLAVTFS